jgi:hypothetical protein
MRLIREEQLRCQDFGFYLRENRNYLSGGKYNARNEDKQICCKAF